jgi:hypothetical protein
MIGRMLALGGIGVAITLAQSPRPETAQGTQLSAHQTKTDAHWTPPKTPWGEPHLKGIWPINHLIAVPLEPPRQCVDHLYLTGKEFAEAQSSLEARDARPAGPIQLWHDRV